MKQKQYFQVRYSWRDERGQRKEGRTVVTALSQMEAEGKFQRQNQHVTVNSLVTQPREVAP